LYIYEGCTRKEIEIYRELQNEPFDFGTGLIVPDNGGEEAYYEMALEYNEWDYLLSGFDNYRDRYEVVDYSKDMTRAKRRKKNWSKAIYKRKHGYMHLHDKPLQSLNKGKNFCSCSLCTPKTNPKGKRYFGSQKIKYKQRNWKHSDRLKIGTCDSKLYDYENRYNDDRYWEWYDEYVNDDRWHWFLNSEEMLSDIIRTFDENDVHIVVNGSYWINGEMFEYHKEYNLDYSKMHLVANHDYTSFTIYWLDQYVIDELKTFIKGKGLNMMCSDICQGKLFDGMHIQDQPWFSIYNDQQDWVDGSYINIKLANYRKCRYDEFDEE